MAPFSFTLKHWLLLVGFLSLPIFAYVLWQTTGEEQTLSTLTDSYQQAGTEVRQDLETLAPQAITEEEQTYTVTDTTSDGIDISFANEAEPTLAEGPLGGSTSKSPLTLSFPRDYSQPIEVKLDDKRTITITDLGGKSDYQSSTISASTPDSLGGEASKSVSSVIPGTDPESRTWFQKLLNNLDPRGKPEDDQFGGEASKLGEEPNQGLFESILSLRHRMSKSGEAPQSYLRYTSNDGRKELLYAYQKDQATGEKKLKHWTLYQEGNGVEQESYQIENAKLKITEEGIAQVFYYGEQDLKNDQAATEVDSNLLERAQRTLAKEMGDDLINGNHTPDLTIPKPYYIDKNGEKHDAEWKWHEETKTLSVSFTPESYPVALDPTLSFTAPGTSNSGSVITGEATNDYFGYFLASGDFNADGKTDLAVGAHGYSTNTGRVYIFYNDNSLSTTASGADVIITGEATSYFGYSPTVGDFNTDGKTDLAVGAPGYSIDTGRAYIFYSGSIITENASGADIIITGETTSNSFGVSLASGDFNADGKTDLAVGAFGYSTYAGRTYIFYNGSIVTENASGADVKITGEAGSAFGIYLASGDWNADGKTDLAVGALLYASYASTGRAYLFYNGSIITEAATGADVIITGETAGNSFGRTLASGDFNADGKTDLAVGANGYSSSTGRAYIFYSGAIITENASGADVKITGEATSNEFGYTLATGDWNADGRIDLAVSARTYSTSTGRAYIFYNDGSLPTTAATADVIITGEGTNNYFGSSLASGDFNSDGKTDLAVGAYGYAGSQGRAYIFYSQNGQVNTNQSIVGEATSNDFGASLVTGDLNADGRIDLVVGAPGYDTGAANRGRAYVFYNDGSYATGGASADAIITGEAASNFFGRSLVTGDFNADGKTDLAVGAYGYSSSTGRAYLFYNGSITTEGAATADVIITGNTGLDYFGFSLTSGDFNADSKTDLAVGAYHYSSSTGRVYIFHNDGTIPTTAATADITITGGAASDEFGVSLASGDYNADGKTDLAVGADGYSSIAGGAYVFYNGSIITEAASGADVIITGEASSLFGQSLTSGDYNADGKTDLAVGAYFYSSLTGRAYIFYNGSITTEAASGADIIITGEASSNFGWSLASGDFNADGRTDLAVGAPAITTDTGKVYFFYNDGSSLGTAVCTTDCLATNADVTITGETTSNYFGYAMTAGDMNGDGRTDLVVGAYGNSTSTGKVYIYETRENFAWEIQEQFGGASRTGVNGTGQELQIAGESGSNYFGASLASGDYNADGKTDLAVGAYGYSTSTGRVYIFYGDGSLTVGASSADVIITGEAGSSFGPSLVSGDFNADGKTDLAVGAYGYSTNTGRAYIFYNDGSIPTTAANADVKITGESTSNRFGYSFTTGDFNADGRTDLAVGAWAYSSDTGRAYIFYNGSIITENASGADVIITGGATSNFFAFFLAAGDWNADGKTDLAVGAFGYSTFTGRAYIFYNDGSIPTTAATADIILTGEAMVDQFGGYLTSGDFNADGKTDLAVGAYGNSTNAGRVYIFYNGSIITENASGADIKITGEGSSYFGSFLVSGDFNADSKTDLAVGAYIYGVNTGRAYIFYNDGSIPTTAATADIILTGEATSNYFGASLAAGDWNADGRTDLAVGASGYASNKGKVYIYTFNDPVITGETTSNYFGWTLASGDWNADGKTDLAVGALGYSTWTGRVYLFYNGSIITEAASGADVIITGEASSFFGISLASGDFNSDGKTDLAVGAYGYSTSTGRAYIFYNGSIITEAATGADVIITGEASSQFGYSLAAGDYTADGKTDLAVGANQYSVFTGRTYIFYNGSIITENASGADIILTGEASSFLGAALAVGDFNSDGKTDLAVGAYGYSTDTGRTYLFYNGSIITEAATGADIILTGEASSSFGWSLAAGDYNADGKTDLAVGARGYSTNTGRTYIFYGGSIVSEAATGADMILTGGATSNYFGHSLASGDYNSDGKTDLAVGAYGYSTSTGRVYIFTSEVSAASILENVSAKVRGTIKTRGTIKVR